MAAQDVPRPIKKMTVKVDLVVVQNITAISLVVGRKRDAVVEEALVEYMKQRGINEPFKPLINIKPSDP